jgi:hypothetical protein
MRKIESNETEIIGKWLYDGPKVTGDSACLRIEDLTQNYLRELAANGEDWSILYQDPDDGRYWEFTYPQSHMHGGGPPPLTLLSNEEAKAKYKI